MKNTIETPDLVTVQPKVTVSDGSQGFEWLSIFKAVHAQSTDTNHHSRSESPPEPSLIPQKGQKSSETTAIAVVSETTQEDSESPFIRANRWVWLPSHPKSAAEQSHAFQIALARDIMAHAYFNQVDGLWSIGWNTKGTHAWQRLCLDQGGTLALNGVPSMAAAAAIEWARTWLASAE